MKKNKNAKFTMVMMVIEHFIQRERISTQAVSPTLNIRITVNLGSLEPQRPWSLGVRYGAV